MRGERERPTREIRGRVSACLMPCLAHYIIHSHVHAALFGNPPPFKSPRKFGYQLHWVPPQITFFIYAHLICMLKIDEINKSH